MPYKNKADHKASQKRCYDRKMQDPENRKQAANRSREWRKRNPEKVKEQKKRYTAKYKEKSLAKIIQWTKENPERAAESARVYSREHNVLRIRQLKLDMIAAYGGKCACCGETEEAFLTIDHIYGKGHQHRGRVGKRGSEFYYWLKKQGYPKLSYQLLCFNCNCAKGLRGQCPHQTGNSFDVSGIAC